jgi:hypothetical protein
MDLAEIRFIQKAFITARGADDYRKIRPFPILSEHFKATVPSHTAVGYLETNCQRCTQLCQSFYLLHTAVGNSVMKKFGICLQ